MAFSTVFLMCVVWATPGRARGQLLGLCSGIVTHGAGTTTRSGGIRTNLACALSPGLSLQPPSVDSIHLAEKVDPGMVVMVVVVV